MRALPFTLFVWISAPFIHAAAGEVSFGRDVMPVLSKAGCNAGACHGNFNGKGGFRLSLRGENPAADYDALVTQKPGRRVKTDAPDASLILRKPTLDADHEGGKRFERGSVEWEILSGWIRAGAPPEPMDAPRLTDLRVTPAESIIIDPASRVALHVDAVFSDGTTRDVTRLTTFEPFSFNATVTPAGVVKRKDPGEVTIGARYLNIQKPVRVAFLPARPGFVFVAPPAANYVDEHTMAKWRTLRMNPSAVCDDATFVRRVSLDLIGRLPSADEARAFVVDAAPEKRSRLVDALLARPEFADFWALKWCDLLRVEEKVLDVTGVKTFHAWIRQGMAEGKPLDQFCREILTARGSTYEVAPANYYRALREPQLRSEAVAQVFLGTRVGCAKCHNHPFERWTQDDYYRFAALFDRMDYEIKENKRADNLDKHAFVGEQIVILNDKATLNDPRTNQPPKPGLLIPGAPGLSQNGDRFEQLAAWLTAPENPLFAKVQANRIWFQIFGRGIVDPPDDFRATNPPSIPGLLDALTEDFVRHKFDLRHLIRVICTSRTYQLSSVPNGTNRDDVANFSHTAVTRLPAEPLLDAVHDFLGVVPQFGGDEPLRAVQSAGIGSQGREKKSTECERVLRTFGKPRRLLNSDMERANESSLSQVFALTSGPLVSDLIGRPGNRLALLAASGKSEPEIVDELFWCALTRPPTDVESAVLSGRLAAALTPHDKRARLEDIAWALVNAKEFLLRR